MFATWFAVPAFVAPFSLRRRHSRGQTPCGLQLPRGSRRLVRILDLCQGSKGRNLTSLADLKPDSSALCIFRRGFDRF